MGGVCLRVLDRRQAAGVVVRFMGRVPAGIGLGVLAAVVVVRVSGPARAGGSVSLGDRGQPARQVVLVVGHVRQLVGLVQQVAPEIVRADPRVVGPGGRIGDSPEPVQRIVLVAGGLPVGIGVGALVAVQVVLRSGG